MVETKWQECREANLVQRLRELKSSRALVVIVEFWLGLDERRSPVVVRMEVGRKAVVITKSS
jgi:hypothetical protein